MPTGVDLVIALPDPVARSGLLADTYWLAAASLDRYLHRLGQPHIFGTQFTNKDVSSNDGWTMDPVRTEVPSCSCVSDCCLDRHTPAARATSRVDFDGIAKALATGATVSDIAQAEGICRPLATREANSPECRQLIAEFVSDERDEMHAMFFRALRAVDHAFSARREYMAKDGQIVYGGPDHYARLAATKAFAPS